MYTRTYTYTHIMCRGRPKQTLSRHAFAAVRLFTHPRTSPPTVEYECPQLLEGTKGVPRNGRS